MDSYAYVFECCAPTAEEIAAQQPPNPFSDEFSSEFGAGPTSEGGIIIFFDA